ncbi:auxin-responsive protein SAUR71-like [Momordica charantia]|uniref:Auxin-responsive protein SAUR71-like n=1 Tax=Momordica charantia TaxID=3673 RepID=A0A6J1DNN8_MOMCH|nr:auxin-responsive protein SAUR71-like [Momordica charantia]
MDPKKSNKIRDIVRLQQILKKWKRLANANAPKSSRATNSNKGIIKFLKTNSSDGVPKGYLAVCVGKELKRFVIPTHFLTHPAFRTLLREAEEEFGFHQQGVLQIPCELPVFENILDGLQCDHQDFFFHNHADCDLTPQMCT